MSRNVYGILISPPRGYEVGKCYSFRLEDRWLLAENISINRKKKALVEILKNLVFLIKSRKKEVIYIRQSRFITPFYLYEPALNYFKDSKFEVFLFKVWRTVKIKKDGRVQVVIDLL